MLNILALGILGTLGRQDAPLPHYTFARDEEGWTAVNIHGTAGKVTVTHAPARLKVGIGSLDYAYSVGPDQTSLAMINLGAGNLAKMNSLHFWMRSDHDASIIVNLSEKEGGRYSAICHATKDQWQEVQLSLSDFFLSTDADSPKDPDGKLDADQIESIAFLDIDQMLIQNKDISGVLGVAAGARHLVLSDVQFSETQLPDAFHQGSDGYLVDNYSRSQADWLGFGVSTLSIASDHPFPGRWLKMDYHAGPGRVGGVVKQLRAGVLVGKKTIVVEAGATRAGQVLFQLEQVNGAKFKTMIDIPGMAQSKAIPISIADLTLSDDSPDKNAKLDLSQVKQFVILDVSGFTGNDDDNTLWIGKVLAK